MPDKFHYILELALGELNRRGDRRVYGGENWLDGTQSGAKIQVYSCSARIIASIRPDGEQSGCPTFAD
jgi:hypothetical protein